MTTGINNKFGKVTEFKFLITFNMQIIRAWQYGKPKMLSTELACCKKLANVSDEQMVVAMLREHYILTGLAAVK